MDDSRAATERGPPNAAETSMLGLSTSNPASVAESGPNRSNERLLRHGNAAPWSDLGVARPNLRSLLWRNRKRGPGCLVRSLRGVKSGKRRYFHCVWGAISMGTPKRGVGRMGPKHRGRGDRNLAGVGRARTGRTSVQPPLFDAAGPKFGIKWCRRRRCSSKSQRCETHQPSIKLGPVLPTPPIDPQ